MDKGGKVDPQEFMCCFSSRLCELWNKNHPRILQVSGQISRSPNFSLFYPFLLFHCLLSFLLALPPPPPPSPPPVPPMEKYPSYSAWHAKLFLTWPSTIISANAPFYSLAHIWKPIFPQQACFSWITEHPIYLHAFAVTLFLFARSLLTLTYLLCPVPPLWEALLKVLFNSRGSPFSLIP